jgi:predicted dehydrogenase
MARAAERTGRVLMEAFHYRYHRLFARMREVLRAGELGAVRHLEATFCIPILRRDDIRWRADLAGGALMDAGCYAMHLLRHLAEAEPEVVSARAVWTRGGVDRWLTADLRFPGGRTARLTCALLSATFLRISARVVGDAGGLRVLNWVAPQFFHRLRIATATGTRVERVKGAASYDEQLRAFVAAVRDGAPFPTAPADSIANMRAIDAVYRAAGRPGGQR